MACSFMLRRFVFSSAYLCAAVAGGLLRAPSADAIEPAVAAQTADENVSVAEAWARASAGAAATGAAYVKLKGGIQPDKLIGASTPVAATAEVHETINDNGVMRMRPLGPLVVAPNQDVTFMPGGTHVMLLGLKQKLTAGQSFPLTLTFEHAGPVTVEVNVRGLRDGAGAIAGDRKDSHDEMPMH